MEAISVASIIRAVAPAVRSTPAVSFAPSVSFAPAVSSGTTRDVVDLTAQTNVDPVAEMVQTLTSVHDHGVPDDAKDQCSICCDHAKVIALVPCGHMLCATCALRLLGTPTRPECAECRKEFTNVLRVFT